MTTIVLADDSALFREGLAGLLQRQGFSITAQESTADDLRATILRLADETGLPDILITDVRMPPNMSHDGLTTALELKTRYPQLSIMVLSQYVSALHAQELFSLQQPAGSGGTGYLLKDRVSEVAEFLAQLRTVAGGGVVMDPQVARSIMSATKTGFSYLSPRELEVLELMSQGLSNAQIAKQLYVSGAAVAKHVSAIFHKLQLDPSEENRRVKAILAFLDSQGHV